MTGSANPPVTDHFPQVCIYLLGQFEIRFNDRILKADDWPRKKAASLMKRLAFERRLLKDQVMEFLWPEADLSSAANNLYKTLHVIRYTIDTTFGPNSADAVFRFEGGILILLPDVWVDVAEFESLATSGSGIDQKMNIEKALDIYKNDLLPDDLYEEWTQLPREELFRLQRSARLTLAAIHSGDQDYEKSINLLRPVLMRDTADELVHRELMRLYAFSGQQHEALRQYATCVEALNRELGTLPGKETAVLHMQILNGDLIPPATRVQPDPAGYGKINITPLPTQEGTRPLFVAREHELKFLQDHLQAAIKGAGQIIFISGEAGQGKTSLMAEFAYQAQLQHQDLVVSSGACQNLAGIADPYLPFRDLVAMLNGDWQRPWVGGDINFSAAQRLQSIAPLTTQSIEEHAPDLVGIIALPNIIAQRNTPHRRTLHQRQVFEQMGNLFGILSSQKPLLLLLDDLQWIDNASASLLFYLVRRLANCHVMIIGAFRPSEVVQTDSLHPLAPIIQELSRDRGDIQVDLDAKKPEEERRFVDALLNSEPNRLDASFREALFRRTRGNPLFSIELIKTLQDQGELIKDDKGMWTAKSTVGWDVLPTKVEAVVARRIDRLPRELRQLLETASIEGEYFTVEILAQLHEISILSLLHKLSQELDHRYRLVYEQGDLQIGNQTITRYHFRHNLFQQYLYQQLSPALRRHLHARVAVALEQIGISDLNPLVISLAYHFLAADDATRAVPYLIQAGDDATQRLAFEEAVRFYQSALDHWQGDKASQAKILQKMGEAFLTLGNAREAIGCFIKADQFFGQAGDPSGQGAMQRLIGRSYWELGERANAIAYYYKALDILSQENESVELARAYSGIAQMHMLVDEYDKALDWGQRAIILAEKQDAQDVIIHAQVHVGISKIVKGEKGAGLAMLADSLNQAKALGLPHDAGRAYAGLGDSLVHLERYTDAQATYEQMLAYARTVQASMFEGVALVQLGYLDWWVGRWRSALGRLKEIQEWMVMNDVSIISKIWASTLIAQVYNDLGMPERARLTLSEFTGPARSADDLQTTIPHLVQLVRSASTPEEHDLLAEELNQLLDTAAYPRYETLPAFHLVSVWMAEKSGGELKTLQRLEEVHRKLGYLQSNALLLEARGFAAELRGIWKQAVVDYNAAAEKWNQLERPFELLRTRAQLISALNNSNDVDANQTTRKSAANQIELLVKQLDDPELKEAFLNSPIIMKFSELNTKP